LPNPFEATRYHSLVVEREGLPPWLEVSAWTEEGEIMGIRHRIFPLRGCNFIRSRSSPLGGRISCATFWGSCPHPAEKVAERGEMG
jgi:hypothetical protein